MTKLFCSKTNQTVTLTVMIADSGEAKIWQIDRPGLLAKIYHVPASHEAEKLAQVKDRVAKLEVMVKRVPKDPNAHQNHISFAWPQSLLKDSGGEVVGFLMPEVENSLDLLKVCTPRMRKSLGVDANWYFLHVVARNIAGIIQAIHDEGYVLGDIKLQNILVNNRALPTIIDTDSFQVVDPVHNKVYRCLVASEGFTPSELIGKNIDSITQSAVHDRFRLGVVIYYLLFGGPPFRGSWQGSGDPPEQVELIRRGFWPYAPNSLIQPSNNTIPLDIIHPELQRSFLLCFNDGHKNPSARPTAREWVKNLELAFSQLKSCKKIDSHFYDSKYGYCYWCDRSDSLGIDIFLIGNIQSITPPSVPIPQPIPPSLSPPINNTSRRKILASLGSLGIGGAIYWFGIKPATSSSSPVSQPSPSQTPISKSTSQRASDYMETLPEGIKLEMIAIPAGEFLMGSPESAYDAYKDEKPQHKVKLSHFFMGKYPVTQEQYQAVMGSNPSKFKDNPKNPVDYVSWDDAQSFCQKLSEKTGNIYRLPSEAEWEYACRAGSQTRYYFGDDEDQLGEYAWYSDWQPHPVGLKKPNNWGLYDMHGTVWEWCEDIKHDNYRKAPTDGRAWIDKDKDSLNNRRVRRGGSWAFKSWYCRSARRGWNLEDFRYKDDGFRLALSAF